MKKAMLLTCQKLLSTQSVRFSAQLGRAISEHAQELHAVGSSPQFLTGSHSYLKQSILMYCFDHFESERIWLIDSLQVFDPYALSRVNVSRARAMLDSLMVSRPFTLYQLKDKVFTLTKIKLDANSTIIISGIDCFENDGLGEAEKKAHYGSIMQVLNGILIKTGCRLIIGYSDDSFLNLTSYLMMEAEIWDGRLGQ